MAGRNAHDAIEKYKVDLESAFRCLTCYSRLEFRVNPGRVVGTNCSWILFGSGQQEGIELPGVGRFEASQSLEIIECDEQQYGGKARLTTTLYDYSLTDPNGQEVWCMHWHPYTKNSKADYPHIHLRQYYGGAHLATSRLLVEHAIHWLIEAGAKTRYPRKWRKKLKETIDKYEGERRWH